ncbi:MAG: hypothetical protein IPL73_11775 [Candidatus Obscuribacter sp.]|nr:hypothetical protein [Candidatus Obscuribacter sp.]
MAGKDKTACSFCGMAGKDKTAGRKLIRGEKICICDDCVDICLSNCRA